MSDYRVPLRYYDVISSRVGRSLHDFDKAHVGIEQVIEDIALEFALLESYLDDCQVEYNELHPKVAEKRKLIIEKFGKTIDQYDTI